MERKLLILDIDETLVFSATRVLAAPADFLVDRFHVYKRPYCEQFISECAKLFDLAVWSSASEDYIQAILAKIVPSEVKLEFIWTRFRCTVCREPETQEIYYRKNFKKLKPLGYPLEQILIVDNDPRVATKNYGNAVYVSDFYGDQLDNELLLLLEYLKSIHGIDDFRIIEKRGWKNNMNL